MLRSILLLSTFFYFGQSNLWAQKTLQYIIINGLTRKNSVVPKNARIEVYKTDLRSVHDASIAFPVFNIFYIPQDLAIEEKLCNSCLQNTSLSEQMPSNRLFVSFSILPTPENKIIKRKLDPRDILNLPILSLSSFHDVTLSRLRDAINNPNTINSFSTKSLDFRIIIKEDDGFFLYENLTLTEFYRVAKNDAVYYPIDNDNITINAIARPFSRNEFQDIFKNGNLVVHDGFLNESEKNKIDRNRLSNKIYRESMTNDRNSQKFWYLPFNTISPMAIERKYLAGIGVFDFNNCFGILGGAYYFHFNKEFSGYMKDQSITDKSYTTYFKAYKINNFDIDDFLKQNQCN